MSKCKTALGATRVRSDNPLAPFNDIFPPPKKFQQIPPKSHATHIPSSGKVHQDIRFASFALSAGSSVKQNRRENRKAARLEGITVYKTFRPRLCFPQPVYSLTSLLKRPENSPISRNFLRRGRLWTADFGWGVAKLGVPRRDVETGGEIV